MAAKKTYHFIKGLSRQTDLVSSKDGNVSISDSAVNIFYGYTKDEYNRIQLCKDQLEEATGYSFEEWRKSNNQIELTDDVKNT
ncbi:hypothetical protein, partial [Loigolactobacillus coryniformis]|uniref:hypothetical protein n=1 Tax=Loigolactobacillus coryniformis TaxID=1610 RepID=UPI00201B1584